MYRVEVRYIGEGIWRPAALPATLQAAYGQAGVLSNSRTADQARVVAAEPLRILDRRV
ncbi:hypothetical protein [Phenylobacterium sp. J367]|uniref:hypothetical protein n=1 Tax=Phenylobacterium sp. J367 TaxID=2898435 RepID=UPI002151EE23|nr:hypothetical protein [Phenylobacterium sp. J367]MCR5879713.1 hypothetical protein [Phenylobacterium sp. J367]